MRGQRGFALIIVLWSIGLLALLAVGVVGNASREAMLTSTLRAQAVARAAADAVLSEKVLEMLQSGSIDPAPRRFGTAAVAVNAVDLSGRMNPNIASTRMLQGLLLRLGMAPQTAESLAAAIADWRTPGLSPSPHGAKAAQYRAAGMTYGPPGRPFQHLDELGYVLGMTPAILAALKPHLTLWSTSDPDPAAADALVLGALRSAGIQPVAAVNTQARVIAFTATATLPDAPQVTRRAVIRFGFSPDGRGWRVLAWDDGATGE